MPVSYFRGQALGREDLNLFLENGNNTPMNAAEISYALYDVTTGMEVLLGSPTRQPVNSSVGEYYASVIIPLDANLGSYRIRWTFRETVGGPIEQVVMEFDVVDKVTLQTSQYTDIVVDLIRRLRIVLRDNNPDRNYHFRPPAHEETVQQFNRVFGFIWEDTDLEQFLEDGMNMIIAAPPRTFFQTLDQFMQMKPEWRTLLLNGAMMEAIFALQLNWIADEFDYSIGGVSLNLEKSAKYESAYQAIKDTWKEQLDAAKATVKIISGLQQPKYGIGIRSAFGPYTGSGILTPRKFVGF
jgi:hypothetical protein